VVGELGCCGGGGFVEGLLRKDDGWILLSVSGNARLDRGQTFGAETGVCLVGWFRTGFADFEFWFLEGRQPRNKSVQGLLT
jgi:hypothetical protein